MRCDVRVTPTRQYNITSDVTGTHGITTATYSNAGGLKELSSILEDKAKDKNKKHKEAVESIDRNFRPLVFETISGALHKDFKVFITSRSEIIADRTGMPVGTVRSQWMQKFQCIIRSEVAQTINSRVERLLNRRYPRNSHQELREELSTTILVRISDQWE